MTLCSTGIRERSTTCGRRRRAAVSFLVVLTCWVASRRVDAQQADHGGGADSGAAASDTAQKFSPWLLRHTALAFSAATAATFGLAALDHPTIHELDEPHARQSEDLHDLASGLSFLGGDGPFVLSAAAAVAPIGGTAVHRFAVHNVDAIALATVLTGLGKGIAGRALPNVRAKHAFQLGRGFHEGNGPFVSFPSGHTAAAFAMASTVAGEVGRDSIPHAGLWSAAAFGVAGSVAVARVVQRVHWPSDLPMGAFIGTWSGYIVQARADRTDRLSLLLRGMSLARDAMGRLRIGWSSLGNGAN